MAYPIKELKEDSATQLEQLGTKTKFWFRNERGEVVLFKEGRPGTGENWAEKVSCELCRLLDIPHAEYDLAVWGGRKGVVTPSFVPNGSRLVLGNELLAKIMNDYEQGKRFKVRQHTVRTVMAALSPRVLRFPLGWKAPRAINDCAGLFVGYLMLDTLISNQDRHHENWGVVLQPGDGVSFAPTFDHASSLGRNETDSTRIEMLQTKDKARSVEAYVARAKSAFFATPLSSRPFKTMEAFEEAAKIRRAAAHYWLEKLGSIATENYGRLLAEIPDSEISVPARDFARSMLETNAKRLLQKG